ncbi:TadE/TadG family type IV pilus assembly protein [Zavarzinella formosa]|uniref:TadE/TadG family type IV pilus assembly protein n=1 Tax=Zavarzinella formosa TaxID=360055 RepID=UPI0002E7C794|nr:TadE/TadG family type IV pilus assembly protein [Zavarzinella formosa]
MRSINQRTTNHRPGAAAVELALVLPFLVVMFTAAVDFARIYHITQTIQECAQSGAIYASGTAQFSSSIDNTQAATNAACASGANLSPAVQAANVSVVIDSTGKTATVTVTYTFNSIMPFLSSATVITRSATMSQAPVPGQ